MITALGWEVSSQASCHLRRRRLSSWRYTCPAGEQQIQPREQDAQRSFDGTPLHAAEAQTQIAMMALPSPVPLSTGFGPACVNRVPAIAASSTSILSTKGIDVTERIPRDRRCLCGPDGGTHMLLAQ